MVDDSVLTDVIRVAREHGNAITVIPCAEAMLETAEKLGIARDHVVAFGDAGNDG